MKVEVIYALPDNQKLFFAEFSEKFITVRQVIQQSKIFYIYPELENLEYLKIGIYSKIVDLDHYVNDKDRVEIYRHLTIDPKQARMLRFEQSLKK